MSCVGVSVARVLSCSVVISTVSATVAIGQQSPAVDLPPLTVTGASPKKAKSPPSKKAAKVIPAAAPAIKPSISGPSAPQAELANDLRPYVDVPSGVSVVTGSQAQAYGIDTARDIAHYVPNMFASDTGGNRMTNYTIRGVHELGYQSSPGVVPNAAYYVDDVPALTTLARASMFANAGEIAVLKGPQNTGFGFSRPAGTIDIHSQAPSSRPTGYVSAGVGNYDAFEAGAGFSTPLGSNQVFLTADFLKRSRDGFYDNAPLGTTYGDKDAWGGKGRLTILPTAGTVVDIFVQHERFDDQSDPFLPLQQIATDPFSVTYNDPGYERIGQDMQALRIKTAIEGVDVVSITAHRLSTWDFLNDGDQTASSDPSYRFLGYTAERVRSFTQELRLSSRKGSPIAWSGGLFGAHTVMNFDAGTFIYPDIPYSLRHAQTRNTDFAAFGEVKLPLSRTLTLAPGLRYEWAGREGDNQHSAPSITSASDSFAALLPSLALVYEPARDVSAYAKYTRGFKPGGFIIDRASTSMDDLSFDSETSNNYEVGFKSIYLDGRAVLNGALFYSDFDNYQAVTQFSPTDFGVNNAQSVRTYGGELEGSYFLTPELRLFAGLGATHARFEEYRNGYGDFSGNDVSYIPSFTTNYGFEYRAAWGGYLLVSGRTLGGYYIDEGNANRQDGPTIVNATIGFKYENVDVSVFGRNIFDEHYIVSTYDFAGTGIGAYGALADPATYGVRTKVSF